MGLSEQIRFFAVTDPGRVREHNEDNYLVDRKLALFVVADGMGGHAAGEVASALAVRIVHEEVKNQRELVEAFASGADDGQAAAKKILSVLEGAVQRASSRIHEEARADANRRGMGTTLSTLLIAGSRAFMAHVGDSRIYLLRDGRVRQLTEDHTVINELVKRGKLTREQIEKVAQKNAITRAVGVYERVEVDTLTLEVLPQDQFLLASDGLHGYIAHPAELEQYFEEENGEVAARGLIDLANHKGGKDNITAVLVRLGEGDTVDRDRGKLLALTLETLAKMPLFSRLTERELLRVMQVAELLSFAAGETIVTEGSEGDQVFIVLTGIVEVRRSGAVLADVGPGEHFGEMALIRALPRSASAVSVEACDLIAIRRGDFFEILRKEHELGVKLLWQLLGVLADRLDQTSRDLSSAREELRAVDISDEIFAAPESNPEPDLVEVEVTIADSDRQPDLSSLRAPRVPRMGVPPPPDSLGSLLPTPAGTSAPSVNPPPVSMTTPTRKPTMPPPPPVASSAPPLQPASVAPARASAPFAVVRPAAAQAAPEAGAVEGAAEGAEPAAEGAPSAAEVARPSSVPPPSPGESAPSD